MEVDSLNSAALFEDEGNGMSKNCDRTGSDGHHDVENERKEPVPPCVGMEFDSYDAAYDFYNCYAKELGFGTRVRCSWFNKKNREKCGAVLCCSREGFKQKCDTTRPRADTRTGCPALLRLRLMDSGNWRVTEVSLEHNHLLSPANIQLYRSHKNFGAGVKRKCQLDYKGIQTNNLYQVLPLDVLGYESIPLDEREALHCADPSIRLKLKEGDAQALSKFFCRMQLMIPNFFCLMDHNNEGHLRNVFWADARSRTAYHYFGEVVAVDTACLTSNYEIPLVSFLGVNHHGQLVLLGCGLLASETGHAKSSQFSISNILSSSFCCHITQKVPEKLRELGEYEAIKRALSRAVYDSLRMHEFENAIGRI
ncbi:protein FAR1-RELATED SEQUENCE 6-like [Telopea speciosissima]|uniref:protein FAR1-RELATED SEQUENCE 6-like n=1 Tax=Telopea speciosissima TaxID=54955 RepID=UPI001CC372F2|nr:protein FAR1-RELATED SEQUENCE 6-like [Telopea speciosissima]